MPSFGAGSSTTVTNNVPPQILPNSSATSMSYNMIYDQISNIWVPLEVAALQTEQANVINVLNLVSGTFGATGATANFTGYGNFRTALFQLDVVTITGASGGNGTLDVYVDTQVDGASFFNMIHFAQFTISTGSRGAQLSDYAPIATSDFDTTSDLTAGGIRSGPWGSVFRIHWVITGTSVTYQFNVNATFRT
jgi:hypothetical protein